MRGHNVKIAEPIFSDLASSNFYLSKFEIIFRWKKLLSLAEMENTEDVHVHPKKF